MDLARGMVEEEKALEGWLQSLEFGYGSVADLILMTSIAPYCPMPLICPPPDEQFSVASLVLTEIFPGKLCFSIAIITSALSMASHASLTCS